MKCFLHPILGPILVGLPLLYLSAARASQNKSRQDPTAQVTTSQKELAVEPNTDIYRYHGLEPAEGKEASNGIYQDFSLETATVGKLWADPDAKNHEGEDFSWVQAYVNRDQASPHLTVDFARHGYGTSVSIVPKNRVPEKIPGTARLTFEARSSGSVCLGIRFMDRDGEIWVYGTAPLNYKRLCVEPGEQWTKFTVPLTSNHPDWFKFKHSGNVDLGNQVMEASLMAGLEFELGLAGEYYFSPGPASFDLRDINVEKAREL
ncbi:hypothetical protein U2F10_02915 [Leptothoe sp. EHU-05/26/07-4]